MTLGNAAQTRRWLDLTRFGARLTVLPPNTLRGTGGVYLDVFDRNLFSNSFGFDDKTSDSETESLRGRFKTVLATLGFPDHGMPMDGPDDTRIVRFFAPRMKFEIAELQLLMPDLGPGDLIEMPMSQIVQRPVVAAESLTEWRTFVTERLATDATGVWFPKVSKYDRPYAESPRLEDAVPRQRGPAHSLFSNHTVYQTSLTMALQHAGYRQNALIDYYADLETAVADGWTEADLQYGDLPGAAPLWVTAAGRITGISDLRQASEVFGTPPSRFYGKGTGLAVAAIRSASESYGVFETELARWNAWEADPTLLATPVEFTDSLARIVGAAEATRRIFTSVRATYRDLVMGGDYSIAAGNDIVIEPVGDLAVGDMAAVVDTLSAHAPGLVVNGSHLRAQLELLLATAKSRVSEHARELAAAQLGQLAATVQLATPRADQALKHVDAGEKIGGARKDYGRRSMTIDDIEGMSDIERRALVIKANVWPPLDYAKMREDGVMADAAVALKYCKDQLETAPSTPSRLKGEPEAAAREYIHAITVARKHLEGVRTLDELTIQMHALFNLGSPFKEGRRSIAGGSSLQEQWGKKFAMLAYSFDDGRKPYRIDVEVRKKCGRDPDNLSWDSLIKPSKNKKDDAEIEESKAAAEQDRLLHRPHLAKVERRGTDWRGGRDVTAQDLVDNFGFKGVEWGNWIDQSERAITVNMAFDSFSDLAQSLAIPPKAISLDGSLAIAFGARGKGGKNAALAHFEPGRNVINLTRMNGAGALAHEWMHALDFHLGGGKFASETVNQRGNEPMATLVRRMRVKSMTEAELHAVVTANALRGRDNVASWLYLQPSESRTDLQHSVHAFYDRMYSCYLAEACEQLPFAVTQQRINAVCSSVEYEAKRDFLDDLKARCESKPGFTKVREKIEGNLAFMSSNLKIVATIEAAETLDLILRIDRLGDIPLAASDFLLEAKKLDATRSKAYWATTCELFARAGAAFVQDKIAAHGGQSDYLVYGSDEGAYAEHPIGNPNPSGADRAALAREFEALINDYRLQAVTRLEDEPASFAVSMG